MFEQSIIATQPQNKTWTLGISILAQMSLVSAAVLFPLVYTDVLPAFRMFGQSVVAPPHPVAPKTAPLSRPATQSTLSVHTVFIPPSTPTKPDLGPEVQPLESYEPSPIGIGTGVTENPIGQMLGRTPALSKPHDPPAQNPVKPHEEARAPVRVSGPVQEAKLLRKIIPIYPQLAIATRTQGTVHLVGVISKDGTIRNLQVIDGPPLLIRAAMDAVKQWVYRPTLLGADAVEVVAPITVTFILNR